MKRFVAVAATLLGAGLLVAGAAMLSTAAGVLLAGVLCVAYGVFLADAGGEQ